MWCPYLNKENYYKHYHILNEVIGGKKEDFKLMQTFSKYKSGEEVTIDKF